MTRYLITCPNCYALVEVMPDEDGQVTCPACKSWYPLSFAKRLSSFEMKRKQK